LVYTGFSLVDILEDEECSLSLPYIDFLVTGPYVQEEGIMRSGTKDFIGSSNQRFHLLSEDSVVSTLDAVTANDLVNSSSGVEMLEDMAYCVRTLR
jgi:hypothetical protein